MKFTFAPTAPFDETGPIDASKSVTIKIQKDDERKARILLRNKIQRDSGNRFDFRTWKLIHKAGK